MIFIIDDRLYQRIAFAAQGIFDCVFLGKGGDDESATFSNFRVLIWEKNDEGGDLNENFIVSAVDLVLERRVFRL